MDCIGGRCFPAIWLGLPQLNKLQMIGGEYQGTSRRGGFLTFRRSRRKRLE
jgi:hypothetical protein